MGTTAGEDKEIEAPLLRERGASSVRHGEVEEENSPIEQVALTVPITDDPEIPVLTFRMWVLGTFCCIVLSFLNQFFWYRREPISVTSISAQIAVVPLGRLMASTLPSRAFFKDTRYEFSLNPGPFNMKEHVLITIFANAGAGSVYAIHVVTAVKIFYGKRISFFVSLLVVFTTQVLNLPLVEPNLFYCFSFPLPYSNLRCSDSAGPVYSGDIWWNRRRCGGLTIWSRSPSLGTQTHALFLSRYPFLARFPFVSQI